MNNNDTTQETTARSRRITMIVLVLAGLLFGVLALTADFLGLDTTPGFGVAQMLLLLLSITCLTTAVYIYVYERRGSNAPRSLQADIGIRLGATGLVLIYVAGFSDLIGIGTHVQPNFERPFVGPLQLGGMALGVLSISVGLYLYYTSRGERRASSLEFILNDENGDSSLETGD